MAVYKDKNGWKVVYRYKTWDGKTKQTTKRNFRTKKEAQEYEAQVRLRKNADMNMTLQEFVPIYFEDKKNEIAQTSTYNKKDMINCHVIPYFGNKRMNDITASDLIKWQNVIEEMGYAESYKRMLQNHLNAILNHAQRIYGLESNPTKKVRRMGKSDGRPIEFWTKNEYDTFIATVDKKSRNYIMFEILFWTGMRESELLALVPDDIDFVKNLIHINRGYHRMHKEDIIDKPKTECSIRTISIPEFLKNEIREYLDQFYEYPADQRIFPIVARTLQKNLKSASEKAGVKHIRVHDLRHSHAAYLIHQGVEPMVIRDRLGHKDIKVTLNTYGHLYPSRQKEVADMLDQTRKEDLNDE